MTSSNPATVYRLDYTASSFLADRIDLVFDLAPSVTQVRATTELHRNPDSENRDIVLYGEELELVRIAMNGKVLAKPDYATDNGELRIPDAPDKVTLVIDTLLHPDQNTSLMGLYLSNGNFFTQCEAEGFRKITYFPDRPDVMATYTVTLRADREKYPVLLSNGNLVEEGDLPNGRHYAKWEDPFKKPSYLFALVAGNLVCREETFRLADGRDVLLQVWVEKNNLDKTAHAMESLKHSIRWDERRFGLELDLDRFMIVAVSDFNMGAMENKGLNIFNTRYVLANPRIATDLDYANIESVVGHEYFHNWTGNRVTCRDWFQLSLKEGLTVFRDQEFSADRTGSESGRAVKRIEDVRTLRQLQFPEDAGPMAHPVRPDSYQEINNFYTVTVYEKGAEVVRMYQTLLGRDGFRKGMDLYFKRHDGQAVTCTDFLAAMADANGRDLSQFERWYSQAGTPRVKLQSHYDEKNRTLTLILSQSCPQTPGQTEKQPFLIPVAIGLLDSHGKDMPLRMEGDKAAPNSRTLELSEESQTFTFIDVAEKPVVSALRNFSAPVILEYEQSDDELLHLLSHDSDHFNRWEAGQRLALRRLLSLTKAVQADRTLTLDSAFIDAFRAVLTDTALDPALRELALTLPGEMMIAEKTDEIDPAATHRARQFMRRTLAENLEKEWLNAWQENRTEGAYRPTPQDAGKRALKNLALSYLLLLDKPAYGRMAIDQYHTADNMSDRLAALTSLVHSGWTDKLPEAKALPDHFYREYENEALVIDKWFSLQATSPNADTATVRKLMKHPAFTLKNPNRARSLIFGFCHNNMAQFHAADGSGYTFWSENLIELDRINPQVAARLARCMDQWKRYIPSLRKPAEQALRNVSEQSLSRDTREIIGKTLSA
ncbi:aminopeptidase N [Oxalobacter paraformigenes]|uniref:Aminopeptidase N n=1 Tax=Oxalobacter paraformigenes TaxID=556268 RepID=C3X4D0_9BURK|nr:aminopeptidase N [Oxalobacter paraformigenes]EEO28066.2 aminopeptidase N [Oxalobacter paraformigenes]